MLTIIGSADDCIYFMPGLFEDRRYFSVDLSQDLAKNAQKIDIERQLGPNTFVIDILYPGQINPTIRGQVVSRERQKMRDFLEAHKNELELIFQMDEPNHLAIYRWKEN